MLVHLSYVVKAHPIQIQRQQTFQKLLLKKAQHFKRLISDFEVQNHSSQLREFGNPHYWLTFGSIFHLMSGEFYALGPCSTQLPDQHIL